MRFSYSNVSCFGQCPHRWKLRYHDRLETLPECNADNPLYLGTAIHKGIELSSVDDCLEEYKSHYNVLTDENINWMIQLEYQLPKVIELLPEGGEHEVEIKTDSFVGYIDYVVGDTLYDFKFSNNIEAYLKSPQLSIYKAMLERTRPDIKINHLKYIFIPKVMIRQRTKAKPPETLMEFRNRMLEHLRASEIKVIEVEYDETSVAQFEDCCKFIAGCTEYPKIEGDHCRWCQFYRYCQFGEDWMIL